MTILTFDHLLNKDLFTNVKKEFLEQEVLNDNLTSIDKNILVDINIDQITVFVEKIISTHEVKNGDDIDEVYNTEVNEKILYFYTDFLIPKISEIESAYKKEFTRDILKRNLFSESAVEGYSKYHLGKLNKTQTEIKDADHLSDEVKEALLHSVSSIYGFISNKYYQENFEIDNKFPLKLNKNQIITLFYLLKNNEYILLKKICENDLSRLIEQNFLYYNSSEECYKEIQGARKLELKLFGRNGEVSPQTTLDELKAIFTNEDFYSET